MQISPGFDAVVEDFDASASLLVLNGLRISEALGADIDDLEYERGHRTLKILR